MAYHDRAGAYQAYTVVPAWTTFPLGPRTSFEDAATVPLAAMTACLGLFVRLKVPEPNPDGSPNPANNGKGIMVWGASSSVGAFAVQLARLAGLYVIGIAGAGAKLAKEMGCDVVVDYRAPDVGTKLRAAVAVSGRTFIHAYDAHSGRSGATSSYEELGAAMQPNGGAICIVRSKEAVNRTIAMPKEELEKIPKNVEVYPSMVGTAHYWDRDGPFAKRWFRQMGRWLEEGKFKPNVVRIIPGGLAGVSEGLKLLEENKISGEKLVCGYCFLREPSRREHSTNLEPLSRRSDRGYPSSDKALTKYWCQFEI